MLYSATIDSETGIIIDSKTQEPVDAIAGIPSYLPDLQVLIQHMPRNMAGEPARMAAWKASGFDATPGADSDA